MFTTSAFALNEFPDALQHVAANWISRRTDPLVVAAVRIFREKFETVDHHGPEQLAIFHDSTDEEEHAMHKRRAFELVQRLLSVL